MNDAYGGTDDVLAWWSARLPTTGEHV
jgi:hypothetical protein